MDIILFLVIMIFLVGTEMAIPFLAKRTTVFGVSIPDEYCKDATLVSYKKRYTLLVFIVGALAIASYVGWILTGNPPNETQVLVGLAIQFGILIICAALYFYFHAKTLQQKSRMKWGENDKRVKVMDLSVRSQDSMLPWYIYLLPIVVTLGVIVYTILNYSMLPEQVPVHWGPNGEPDAFTPKTYVSAISLPLVMLVIQCMFLGINETTKRSGIKLSATRPEASRIRQLTLRKYTSWFLFLVSILMTMLFSYLQLRMVHPDLGGNALSISLPFLFLIVILVSTIFYAIKVGRAGENMNLEQEPGIVDIDEDQYWIGGIFYFNKNDPSIFVEKRFGIGWTINFANPLGYLMIFGPLLLILLITILT